MTSVASTFEKRRLGDDVEASLQADVKGDKVGRERKKPPPDKAAPDVALNGGYWRMLGVEPGQGKFCKSCNGFLGGDDCTWMECRACALLFCLGCWNKLTGSKPALVLLLANGPNAVATCPDCCQDTHVPTKCDRCEKKFLDVRYRGGVDHWVCDRCWDNLVSDPIEYGRLLLARS